MVSAGTEYVFWASFFALLGSIWLVYEVYQWATRRERRRHLPPPIKHCIPGHRDEAWIGRRT